MRPALTKTLISDIDGDAQLPVFFAIYCNGKELNQEPHHHHHQQQQQQQQQHQHQHQHQQQQRRRRRRQRQQQQQHFFSPLHGCHNLVFITFIPIHRHGRGPSREPWTLTWSLMSMWFYMDSTLSILLSWNPSIVVVEMIGFPSWLFYIIPLRPTRR